MRKALLAGVWLLASAAAAGPRMYVLGTGDCRELDLQTNRRAFWDELHKRMGDGLLTDEGARNLLAPEPGSTVEELQNLLEKARQQYYQAQYEKAEQNLESTLKEIRRLPVGSERWNLTASGELLKALIYRNTRREKLADEAFRKVLRLDAGFQMDSDYYSPTTRARFEVIRKELAAARKRRLTVTSPPLTGVGVYLDGFKVGVTPFTGELLPGSYELALAKDGDRSLPHALNLNSESTQQISFAFESAIHPSKLPCLAKRPEAELLGYAVSLGPLLGVDEVVVLRLEQPSSGPGWLAVTLVNTKTGGKVREGGLKFYRASRTAAGLAELAEFVLSGKQGGSVELSPFTSAEETPAIAQKPSPAVSGAVPATSAAAAEVVQQRPQGARSWKTPVGVGLLAAGVLGGGAAGWAFQRTSIIQWNEHDSYFDLTRVPTAEEALRISASREAAIAAQTNAIIAFGVGGAAAVAGAVLVLMDGSGSAEGPRTSLTVTVAPSRVGATLRFP